MPVASTPKPRNKPMAQFPERFIEEVRERVDMVELIGRRVQLRKTGSNWQGLCPFHNEKTPSFSVRPDKGFYKCFGCGARGDAIDFVMQSQGLPFHEAVEELARTVGVPLPEGKPEDADWERRRQEQNRLLEVMNTAQNHFVNQARNPNGHHAWDYLLKRGLRAETLERFGLGYAPPGWRNLLERMGGGEAAALLLEQAGLAVRGKEGWYDRFRDRITFPIHDLKNRIIGFGGRVLDDSKPKYINSPETELYHKGDVLYGLNLAQEAIRKEGLALVVEGYLDLVALADRGVLPVAATLGTALTANHLRILWQRTQRVIFCFDGDTAGRKAAWRALEQSLDSLKGERRVEFLFLPEGRDPDDVVKEEGADGFRRRLERTVSLGRFLLKELQRGLDVESPEGAAAMIHRARPLLHKVGDPLLQELLAVEVGQYLQIDSTRVLADPTPHTVARERTKPFPFPAKSSAREGKKGFTPSAREGTETTARTAEGRDFEQVLISLLLRHPQLLLDHEEELSQLHFDNHRLALLRDELLVLGTLVREERPDAWPLERLGEGEALDQARRVLRAEKESELIPEREFLGCLAACQLRQIHREMRLLEKQSQLEGGYTPEAWVRSQGLRREEKRLKTEMGKPILEHEGMHH